jgi:hypothetical protein
MPAILHIRDCLTTGIELARIIKKIARPVRAGYFLDQASAKTGAVFASTLSGIFCERCAIGQVGAEAATGDAGGYISHPHGLRQNVSGQTVE